MEKRRTIVEVTAKNREEAIEYLEKALDTAKNDDDFDFGKPFRIGEFSE